MARFDFSDFMKSLGGVVKKLRKDKGLTQGELGEKIGKPQSTIARLESALVNDTHISLVYQISGALQVDMSTILAEVISRSIAESSADKKDIEGRWEIIKEKVSLLGKKEKQSLVVIFEEFFKLM